MRVSRLRMKIRRKPSPEARREQRRRAQALESPGRRVGSVAGSWVTDLAELRQTIILCSNCDFKWRSSAARYGYEKLKKWSKIWGGVIGKCDGCREPGHQRTCYSHESIFDKVSEHN